MSFDLDNEDIEWTCEDCGNKFDRNSYVTKVTIVTGEVIKAEDGYNVIDMEPQFPPQVEHLCYTCYMKKYKEPVKVLRTVLGVIANIAELQEAETNDDFYNPKETLNKLNELVVYIAGNLPPLVELERASQRPGKPVRVVGCLTDLIEGVEGCCCPRIGTEEECLFEDGVLCSSREGFIVRDLDEEDRQERLTRWATKP